MQEENAERKNVMEKRSGSTCAAAVFVPSNLLLVDQGGLSALPSLSTQ